jgi:AraC-like DNA-binding protein
LAGQFQSGKMLSIRTTEYRPDRKVGDAFEPNMFGATNAFALTHENGHIRVDTAELRAGGLKVSRVRSTGHMVDLTEERAATVLFPRSGQLRVRVAAAEYRISPKGACIFAPNSRRTRAEAPAQVGVFQANALMIPNTALRELVSVSRDDSTSWSGLQDGLPISAKLAGSLRLAELLDYVARHFDDGAAPISVRAAESLATLIEELLLDLVLRSSSALAEEPVLSASLHRVRLAEEIMRARSGEPLPMASLAREVGVGLRSLQLAFMEARAMGPRDMLLRMRLERVRERLMSAGPSETVTSIALDCGFAHLGRFPASYRTAFGELPTQTLADARRRAS